MAHTEASSQADIEVSRRGSVSKYPFLATVIPILLAGLVLVLVIVDMALLRQNRRLRASLNAHISPTQLRAGVTVPALRGTDISGVERDIEFGPSRKQTILLAFRPNCPFCKINWPRWNSILQRVDRSEFRVVFVSLSGPVTSDFATRHAILRYPVFVYLDPADVITYGLRVTPETVLISPLGQVEGVWPGLLADRALTELRTATGVNR